MDDSIWATAMFMDFHRDGLLQPYDWKISQGQAIQVRNRRQPANERAGLENIRGFPGFLTDF